MDNHTSRQTSKQRAIVTSLIIFAFLFFTWVVFLKPDSQPESDVTVAKAIVVLRGDSKVTGTVTFTQASKGDPVTVSGELKNLDPNAKRGFHIHQLGDATNSCLSAGSHFNPKGKNHGARSDTERHVGDLGNIQSDASGTAKFSFTDSLISLNGPTSIIGRSVVVHMGTDDLGRGGDDESLKTGNAGGRAACGVIGLAELA